MKKTIITGFLYLFACFHATAVRVNVNFAENLWAISPIVLKGSVIDVQKSKGETSPYPDTDVYKANLHVHYMLRGKIEHQKATVYFLRGHEFYDGAFSDLQPGRAYILFLKKDAGHLCVYDPFNAGYQVVKQDVQIQDAEPMEILRAEFEQSLLSADDHIVLYGLSVLSSIGNKKSLPAIQNLATATNALVRVTAKALLIRHGEWTYLDDVVSFFNDYPYGYPGYSEHKNIMGIGSGCLGEITNTEAKPLILESLKKSNHPGIQNQLLSSLGRFADYDDIDCLLALYNKSDANVVYSTYKILAGLCDVPMFSVSTFWMNKLKIDDILKKATDNIQEQIQQDTSIHQKRVSWKDNGKIRDEIEGILDEIKDQIKMEREKSARTKHTTVSPVLTHGFVKTYWKRAPIVLKGTVVNVEKRPETNSVLKNADTYLAETSVHHVFKGDIKESPVMVGFFRVKSNNYKAGPYNNMEVGKTYILFLRRKTFDKLRVFDLYNSVYMVENNNIYRQESPPFDRLRAEFEYSLCSTNDDVVLYGLEALFSIGNEASLPAVRSVLESENRNIRAAAQAILVKHGEFDYIRNLADFFGNGYKWDSKHRVLEYEISSVLSNITSSVAQPVILDVLQTNKSAFSVLLLKSLLNFADEDALNVLLSLYKDSNDNMAYAACQVLAKLCGIPEFDKEFFMENKNEIRKNIEESLKHMKND